MHQIEVLAAQADEGFGIEGISRPVSDAVVERDGLIPEHLERILVPHSLVLGSDHGDITVVPMQDIRVIFHSLRHAVDGGRKRIVEKADI